MTRPHTSPLSPYPPWQATGWSAGLISLPAGPVEVYPGWTIAPEEDLARVSTTTPVVMHVSPFLRTSAPSAYARFRITGTVHARMGDTAATAAREEMTRIVSVMSTALNTSLAAISDVWVESGPQGKPGTQFGLDVGAHFGVVQPLGEPALARIQEFWRNLAELRERRMRYALERAAGWYRKAAFDTDMNNRILFCWTGLDALTAAVPPEQARPAKQCSKCKAELRCAKCGDTVPGQGGDNIIPLLDLLVKRYHILGKREFTQMRGIRNQLVHGSVDPAEVTVGAIEEAASKMLKATCETIWAVLMDSRLKAASDE